MVAVLVVVGVSPAAWGATYAVGPGAALGSIGDAPLGRLEPGDVVEIHYRKEPYRETFGIGRAGVPGDPIVIRGVPGPNGELPVIDGQGAKEAHGSHKRGLIHVYGDAAWVVVENLELRHANLEHGYSHNSAGIFAAGGSHITFRNLDIHHNGNGFFSWIDAEDIVLTGSYLHENGNPNSVREHNVYTESNGVVFELNVLLPLLPGAQGNNIKDRSAKTVVRYNWIEGGNRALDLVEAEDGPWSHEDAPAFVYGNVIVKHQDTKQSQVVHFGQDNGMAPRKLLYFYHNTVFSDRRDGTTLFFFNAPVRAQVHNNLFVSPDSPFEILEPEDSSQATLNLGANWISRGWRAGAGRSIQGLESLVSGSEPGLVDIPRDFALTPGSPAVNAGRPLESALDGHPVTHQFAGRGKKAARQDPNRPDLGAFALGSGSVSSGVDTPPQPESPPASRDSPRTSASKRCGCIAVGRVTPNGAVLPFLILGAVAFARRSRRRWPYRRLLTRRYPQDGTCSED